MTTTDPIVLVCGKFFTLMRFLSLQKSFRWIQ